MTSVSIAFCSLLLLAVRPLCGQCIEATAWEQHMVAGKGALASEKYADADAIYSAAVEECRRSGATDARLALALGQLGMAKMAEGRAADATALLRQSIAILQQVPATHSVELAVAWHGLASSFYYQRLYTNAEHAYLKALELRMGAERFDPGTVDLLCNLGSVYQLEHRYKEAGDALDRARALLEKRPPDPVLGASLWNNIGTLSRECGRHAEAEAAYRRAFCFLASIDDRTGVLSIHLLNNLALECIHRRQYGEASALLSRAVARMEQGSALPRADEAQVLAHYAQCLEKAGNKREARRMAARAQEVAGGALPIESDLVVHMSQLRTGK